MRLNGYKRLWKLLPLTAVVFLLATLASCTGEEDIVRQTGEGDALVTLSLRLPGASLPASRALMETDENIVKEIDVLVFNPGGNFAYSAQGTGLSGNGATKTFTVKLRTGNYDLVILANARDIIEAADLTKKNKATALAMLTAAVPEDGKWVATASATGFKPFPMWGDIGTKTISENMEKQSIQLLRMMARVDVTVNLDDEDNVPPFTLTSIHVYNYNTHGTVAPGSELKDGAVTAPTVPTASTLTKGPVLYDGIDGDNNQCVREIYIMEAKNHKDNGEVKALTDRTCLVIGGKYGNEDPTYYRVDFSTGSGISQEYLDVLRNHQYTINITKVSGSGYETPDIAFRSAPVNIQAEVLAWNQVGMNILTTDGQYTLAVSKDAYTFTKEEKNAKDDENTLHIWTDYTTGWKVEKCVDADDETKTADWLSLSPAGAANNGSQPTETFIGLQENDKGSTRRAKIILAAGRLRKEIVVEQTASPKVTPKSIKVEHNTYGDLSNNYELALTPKISGFTQDAHTFKVVWEPATEKMRVAVSGTCTLLDGVPTNDEEHDAGEKTYTIKALPIGSGSGSSSGLPEDHTLTVTFTTESNQSHTLKLVQKNYGLVANGVKEKYVSLDGKTYSFEVESNTDWKIEEVTDGSSVLTDASKADLQDKTGNAGTTAVSFILAQGATGTATLRFVSPDGAFADVEVQLNVLSPAEFAGSNIVYKDGILTFSTGPKDKNVDAQTQGVYFKWGSLVAISPVGSYFSASSVLYKPDEYATTISDLWTSVPYADNTPYTATNTTQFSNNVQTDDDFAGYNGGLGYNASKGVGDICRYISDKGWVEGNWRMPTSAEQEALLVASGVSNVNSNYWGIPIGNFISVTSYDKTGGSKILSYMQLSELFFPAAGYRYGVGALTNVALSGFYWSGSSGTSTDGYSINVLSLGAELIPTSRQSAVSVRCVRE